MSDSSVFTYQTRVNASPAQLDVLDAAARLFNLAEHKLFARIAAGENAMKEKKDFMAEMGVDSRQYNAILILIVFILVLVLVLVFLRDRLQRRLGLFHVLELGAQG